MKRIDVAVGVLIREDGSILLAQRPSGKPYEGWWEFPGGKLEAGEGVAQALVRELTEELGITIDAVHPWLTLEHDYPHARVSLRFCKVRRWRGEPVGLEGQRHGWWSLPDAPEPVLPATVPVMHWLSLPETLNLDDPRITVVACTGRHEASLPSKVNPHPITLVRVQDADELRHAARSGLGDAALVRAEDLPRLQDQPERRWWPMPVYVSEAGIGASGFTGPAAML